MSKARSRKMHVGNRHVSPGIIHFATNHSEAEEIALRLFRKRKPLSQVEPRKGKPITIRKFSFE